MNSTSKLAESNWLNQGRPEQILPGLPGSYSDRLDWDVFLLLAGRGFGKSRSGAEAVNYWAKKYPGIIIHLVASAEADYRDVMVEGESGILSCSPQGFMPEWKPSKRRLEWPNGTRAICFSSEKPRQLRGPQCHKAWADEVAAWEKINATDNSWHQLRFGCRLKYDAPDFRPQIIASTTPTPIQIIRDMVKDEKVEVTTGSTFDNADNLAEAFLNAVVQKYEGTRLGRQELYAELLWDAAGALWHRDLLDANRVDPDQFRARQNAEFTDGNGFHFTRIVVAIDPSISTSEGSDETGIVVCGRGIDGCGYVLADYSGKYTPLEWAKKAVWAFREHKADRIVAEANQGGEMVEATLRNVDRTAPIKLVKASRGKRTRAEPISALTEQHKIKFIGIHDKLEDQLCTWDAADTKQDSPDRLDAFVWAMTELMLQPTAHRNFSQLVAF